MRIMKSAPVRVDVVGLPECLAGIGRLEAFAAKNKIEVPRSSRLGTYIAVVRGLGSGQQAHAGPIDVGGALVELRQLIAIVDGLNAAPQLSPALRVLLDGRYLTLDAPTHDPARDKQFELFVAARFALSGVHAELAEPDVTLELGDAKLGIAAKRPRTPGALKSALTKGRRQIRRANARGFIAVDASMYPLANALVLATFLDRPEDAPRATAEALERVVRQNVETLLPFVMEEPDRSGTLGILFHLSLPFMVDSDTGFTACVGEAWLAVPAQMRLSPELRQALQCLRPNAGYLIAGMPN
jgi:hypothetical protein